MFDEGIHKILIYLFFHVEPAGSDAGLAIVGGPPRSTTIDCAGDPHIAMAATVLALAADGPSTIRGAQCIVDAFPRFVASLRALGASITVS